MMTRKTVLSVTLVLIVVLCAGCPAVFRAQHKFTSAAVGQQGYRFWNSPLAAMADAAEGEAEVVETREVVEPDVIRRNGSLLYVLNQYRGLTLVNLDTQAVVAQVPTFGYPRDLYIAGNRAYVLVSAANNYRTDGNKVSFDVKARLYVVDVTNPAEAAILNAFDLNGDLVDSRLVGNVLYAVCAEYEWTWIDGTDVAVTTSVLKAQTSSSWVTSVNIADPDNIHQVGEVSFAGYGNIIQATDFAIFVAGSDWSSNSSPITYIDISDPDGAIVVRGAINVPGSVADRFKMDAYNGILRVVSNGWWSDRRVYITTIDLADPDNLVTLGEYELEDAIGETLFATRFDGNRAYIVSYLVVDPLFVVDLSNPADPQVTAALEVPGWSTYIEPMGGHLITLGVDNTDGRKVSASLFDVADPAAPALLSRVSFGDSWTWSSAYSDVKAFTVLDDLLIVPFSGWESDFGGYDRLQFISYDDTSLTLGGHVDLDGSVLRSFGYGDAYYALTDEQLAQIDATDLNAPVVTNRLTLAEYIADFIELSPDLAAEIVVSNDSGKTIVRTVGLAKRGLGEVAIDVGSLVDVYAYGQSVIVVGDQWSGYYYLYDKVEEDEPHYTVVVVDCSEPEAPVASQPLIVKVTPYSGYYYWYDWRGPYLLADAAVKSMIAPWYIPWNPVDSTFLLGDKLVLRCSDTQYDAYFGAQSKAYQGLAIVDLSGAELAYATVGLGYDNIVSLDDAGGKLYLGTQVFSDVTALALDFWRPLCSYYLQELDLDAMTTGAAVNVPGLFVQYDPAAGLLVTRDYQWNAAGSAQTFLRTVDWNGADEATLLDDVKLPDGVGDVFGRGDKIYFSAYDNGYKLYAAAVGANAQLDLSDGLLVTDQYATLLDANGNSAYVSIGNAVARYDFSAGGALADLEQVMGWPETVRFGANNAFVSLGYSGIIVLPL